MRIVVLYFILGTSLLFAQENVEQIGVLSNVLNEASGLVFHNDRLITHNDSGNETLLFELDSTSGEILRTITVTNAVNVDWEDMTRDDTYFYVGDIGNFNGDRENLRIYRILISDFENSDNVTADIIDFAYEDQLDFTTSPNSDWDAEALFILDNHLIILTKQWQSNGTTAYSIPVTIGTHLAENIGSFPIDGLVTGATYNPTMDVVFICGYSSLLLPFLSHTTNANLQNIFGDEVIRDALDIGFAQVEAITHTEGDTYFFSTENFTRNTPAINSPARLFSFSFTMESEEEEPEEPAEEPIVTNTILRVYKPPGLGVLNYEIETNNTVFGWAIYDALGRTVQLQMAPVLDQSTIDISGLESAVYYLTFFSNNDLISAGFLVD